MPLLIWPINQRCYVTVATESPSLKRKFGLKVWSSAGLTSHDLLAVAGRPEVDPLADETGSVCPLSNLQQKHALWVIRPFYLPRIISCYTQMWNLVCHSKERTWIEEVWGQYLDLSEMKQGRNKWLVDDKSQNFQDTKYYCDNEIKEDEWVGLVARTGTREIHTKI